MKCVTLKIATVLMSSILSIASAEAGTVEHGAGSSTHQVAMVFAKDGDRSISLRIAGDGTADITRVRNGRLETLIAGRVQSTVPGSYEIFREEGDVCPSVKVEMLHDTELGENMGAQVQNNYESAGSAAEFCSGIEVMDGTYLRAQAPKPHACGPGARCAPPARY
jgi:hypothetical protein